MNKGFHILIKDWQGRIVTPVGATHYPSYREAEQQAAAIKAWREDQGLDETGYRYVICERSN